MCELAMWVAAGEAGCPLEGLGAVPTKELAGLQGWVNVTGGLALEQRLRLHPQARGHLGRGEQLPPALWGECGDHGGQRIRGVEVEAPGHLIAIAHARLELYQPLRQQPRRAVKGATRGECCHAVAHD